jgi:hypothetical protein
MRKLLGVAGLALLVASPAFASGNSTLNGYGGSAGAVQGTVQKSGTLPFTGLSLMGFLVAGLVLVAVGALIRHKGRASS